MSATINRILVTSPLSEQSFCVIDQLCKNKFSVRALLTDEASTEIKKLKDLGVEVFNAKWDNEDLLRKSLQDIDGVFLNLECLLDVKQDLSKAERFIHLCKDLGSVKHLIYSSRVNCEELSGGKYHVPEYVSLCKFLDVIKKSGISYTELRLGFLMNELKRLVQFNAEQKLFEFNLPMADKTLDLLAPEDLGYIVLSIFQNPQKYQNQSISVAGDSLTIEQTAEIFYNVTHKHARYNEVSVKHFKESSLPNAEVLGNLFHFYQDHMTFL